MRQYRRQQQQAKEKAANRERISLEAQLPMSELIAGVAQDIEAFAAELGQTRMALSLGLDIFGDLLSSSGCDGTFH